MEQVVISGISGTVPGYKTIHDYFRSLINSTVAGAGKSAWKSSLKTRQTDSRDSVKSLILKAILDAGINPSGLRGTKVGVYCCIDKAEGACTPLRSKNISMSLELAGPSVDIEETHCGGLTCVDLAVKAIRKGDCTAAIVLAAQSEIPEQRQNESAVVIYLSRGGDAKRVYAEILGTSADSFQEDATIRELPSRRERLYGRAWAESEMQPRNVSMLLERYIGNSYADGAVEPAGFLHGRNQDHPLAVRISSESSGSSSDAQGLMPILIALLSHMEGVVPPGKRGASPVVQIPGAMNALVKLIDTKMTWPGDIVGISDFSDMAQAHIILSFEIIQARSKLFSPDYPILIPFASSSAESLSILLTSLRRAPELHHGTAALLHDIAKEPLVDSPYRGYAVYHPYNRSKNEVCLNSEPIPSSAAPYILFSHTALGSQWAGMGRALMKIPLFAQSISRADQVLAGKMELKRIIESGQVGWDKYSSPLMVTCIQIAMLDLLHAMNIYPSAIVGHSTGEIAGAYADGCMSFEQAVKVAAAVADSVRQATLCETTMANVGLSWEEALKQCPVGIEPSCNNAANNVTISGPPEDIDRFMKSLTQKGILAVKVETDGIAYHSRYIQPAVDLLEKLISDAIGDVKFIQRKWISSSFGPDPSKAQGEEHSVAHYYAHNMGSPVYFKEALDLIPKDALVIEIGPHCLLQGVLKRTFQPDRVFGLADRLIDDQLMQLMETIGKIYNVGVDVDLGQMYSVEFPLKCKIPPLSPLLK